MRISDWSSDVCSSDLVIFQVFPPEKRGTAMGIYGMGVVLAPALGPTLGGVMVDEYSWRDVFLVVLPICAIAIVAAAAFLPGRDPHIVERKRFDVTGFRSEEHTSELQSLMRISYAVFCLKKKT